MTPSSKGLTLVEVLAALVILSLLAAVCVPMIIEARQSLQQDSEADPLPSYVELAELANAAVAAPQQYGAATALQLDGSRIDLPEPPGTPDSQGSTMAVRPSVQLQLISGTWDRGTGVMTGSVSGVMTGGVSGVIAGSVFGARSGSGGDQTNQAEHAWLAFSCGGRAVVRWIALPPTPNDTGVPR